MYQRKRYLQNMFLNIKLVCFIACIWSIQALEMYPPESPVPHSQCPKVDDINSPILLPYPQDCSKYYSCLNGYAYAKKCPENFHWNSLTYRCDYPEKVQCQQPNIPIPGVPTVRPAANHDPNTYYQLYPNDCNRYYQCQAMSCPANYYWNYQKQQCDFPHLAQCPFDMPTVTQLPPIPTAPTAAGPTSSGGPVECPECARWCLGQGHIYMPYPQDCSKFIQCNGLAFIHKCPDQLLWNDKLKTCDRFCVASDAQ